MPNLSPLDTQVFRLSLTDATETASRSNAEFLICGTPFVFRYIHYSGHSSVGPSCRQSSVISVMIWLPAAFRTLWRPPYLLLFTMAPSFCEEYAVRIPSRAKVCRPHARQEKTSPNLGMESLIFSSGFSIISQLSKYCFTFLFLRLYWKVTARLPLKVIYYGIVVMVVVESR